MQDFGPQREQMVRRQIAARGVDEPHVLDAMRRVPRECFVDDAMREYAYEDAPLPIAAGQTISQPYIVARMIELARIAPGERVLEIGTGSGYAAAVMAEIADEVFTIERHAQLSDLARSRFDDLGYSNIDVRTGDGTRGWPEAAPFDAILAAAGGPDVPDVLKEQLAIGGRLVMPVGESLHHQRLVRVTRVDEFRFEQQDLDAVAFVPLIGTYGWAEDGSRPMPVVQDRDHAPVTSLPSRIAAAAEALPADFDDPRFGEMFDRFANARVVLLGEASHGTSEFYRARDAITRRLVQTHGFRIVAAEADWPDMAQLDRFVRHRPPREGAEAPFQRFPTWMWRNREFEALVQWLYAYNDGRPADDRAGLFGLDLYSLGASMRAVIDYLDSVDPEAARVARHRYSCLVPWVRDPAEYGRMSMHAGHALCEKAAVEMLIDLMQKRNAYLAESDDSATSWLDATQNARLVRNAEKYYRTMYEGAAESWNQRDRHMFETLQQLLGAGGPHARAVVWAHNSHIGDARHTEMGMRGELNLGQLCKERWGSEAATIGFGTHQGTVAAASDWDAPMDVMAVRPSLPDSYERQCHEAGNEGARVSRYLLDLREGHHEKLREDLATPRLERFIGVVYRPETERYSHYAQAVLPAQFDAYVWFDETRAVEAMEAKPRDGAVPDTYPFGL